MVRPGVKTVPLAGGTHLLGLEDESIQAVVDLRDLGLAYITEDARGVHIGAMTTLQTMVDSPLLKELATGILARASLASSFSRLIRDSATIGGTLAASAASQADLLTALAVLDVEVVLRSGSKSQVNLSGGTAERPGFALSGVTYKGKQERRVPCSALSTELRPNELIIEVIVPRPAFSCAASFMRIGRTPTDVALLNAAALVEVGDGIYKQVRLALGGVHMEAVRMHGLIKSLDVAPGESLMAVMRREGYYSVKHGCETGECGACTILVDGVPRPSCVTLAAQVGGCTLTTVESLGTARKLHPIQEAFIDTGAIQCGYCTPGMVLCAHALLKRNPHPTEDEVRDALSGNLCRCTGYVKPVQAVLRAAAIMRGEAVASISRPGSDENFRPWDPGRSPLEHAEHGASGGKDDAGSTGAGGGKGLTTNDEDVAGGGTATLVDARVSTELNIVGKAERKVDAVKLVTGKPAFVDDIELRGMLHARLLTSPHAHAVIRDIDVSEARALPGVHAVLTYKDVQRIPYTTAGQSWPEPGPHDQYCLDYRVRFVGDRVAAVAAETPEIAEQALKLIKVDYEVLPALLDPRKAMNSDAPRLHPERESYRIHDASRNIAAHLYAEVGDVARGFAESDLIVEGAYIVPQVQQTPIENHIVITYWDEDDRLVVRTSTQVPYHVRRIIAPEIALSPRRIRVLKPL